jgi:hypothetical protein
MRLIPGEHLERRRIEDTLVPATELLGLGAIVATNSFSLTNHSSMRNNATSLSHCGSVGRRKSGPIFVPTRPRRDFFAENLKAGGSG